MPREAATVTPPGPRPLLAGVRAARANVIPAAVLLVLMFSLVLAYYNVPPVRAALERVVTFKNSLAMPFGIELPFGEGLVFAMIALGVMGGVVPWAIQQMRPRYRDKPFWLHLPFYIIFWARAGAEVHLLYWGLAQLLGDTPTVWNVIGKTLIDQLIYVPLWVIPVNVSLYQWKDFGYRGGALADEVLGRPRRLTGFFRWYLRVGMPVMIANWSFWTPAVLLIYCFPLPLQLPVQSLTLCLWVLLLMFIVGENTANEVMPETVR